MLRGGGGREVRRAPTTLPGRLAPTRQAVRAGTTALVALEVAIYIFLLKYFLTQIAALRSVGSYQCDNFIYFVNKRSNIRQGKARKIGSYCRYLKVAVGLRFFGRLFVCKSVSLLSWLRVGLDYTHGYKVVSGI